MRFDVYVDDVFLGSMTTDMCTTTRKQYVVRFMDAMFDGCVELVKDTGNERRYKTTREGYNVVRVLTDNR